MKYADDLVALCATRERAEEARELVAAVLDPLGLRLHPEKTGIVHLARGAQGFNFLGFHHRMRESWKWRGRWYLQKWPSQRAMASIRAKIRDRTTRRLAWLPLEAAVSDLNPVLRGWGQYFRYSNGSHRLTATGNLGRGEVAAARTATLPSPNATPILSTPSPGGGTQIAHSPRLEGLMSDRCLRPGCDAVYGPAVPDDVEPALTVRRARIITGVVTMVPILSLVLVGWQLWQWLLGWNDVFVFLLLYVLTGLGVTVGFHRLFTHRAFKTTRSVRAVLAILGSAAIEGPVIAWVADHRKHHAFSDREGDPHSPHVDHGGGWRGATRGLWHAHVGWLFIHTHRGRRARYAPDLLADPVISWVDRTFLAWAVGGLIAAFGLGWLFGGRLDDGLTGLLWGGAVRMLVLHHVTYSINSLCHFFGRRPFKTGDESRNLAWLAPLSLGEAWHNNHHAFPTSAEHGLRRWEFDLSAVVIRGLERVGLAWEVVRVSPERQAAKLAVLPGR